MNKWLIIAFIILLLALLSMSQVNQQTKAATTSLSIAPNDLVLRNALNKGAAGFKKTQVIAQAQPPIVTSGLMPKANRNYTYEPSFEGPNQVTYQAVKNRSIANSIELLEADYIGYTYIESSNELKLGVAYSDTFFFSLSYPMKENRTIIDTDYGYDGVHATTEVKVESTSAIVHTKAATFHNVIILAYPNGSKIYLAKDYGIIRITDFQGDITTELIAVE